MNRVWILTILLISNVSAVKKKIILDLPYGVEIGRVKKSEMDKTEEEKFSVPIGYYVYKDKIIIDDKYNQRGQVFSMVTNKVVGVIHGEFTFDYINLDDSVFIYRHKIFRIDANNKTKLEEIYQTGENGFYYPIEYILKHPSGVKIIRAKKNYYLNDEYGVITRQELPDDIEYITVDNRSAWYFKESGVYLGAPPSNLRYIIRKKYYEYHIADSLIPAIYEFPDTSESGNYFENGFSRKYANHDTLFNVYFYSNTCDSFRLHENTYSELVKQTGDPKNPINHEMKKYKEDIAIISSYDRLGKLRFWFPEPPLNEGWKKNAAPIFVSNEGRIFRMVFYSHVNKSLKKNDYTKGIRIYEYIPEKDDFSHEGRMKSYGRKK